MFRFPLFSLLTIWLHSGVEAVEATGGEDQGKPPSNCEASPYLCKPIGLSLITTLIANTRKGGTGRYIVLLITN